MAFPLPKLLPRIEELLQEVQWLDGLILITDSDRACFVSFSQVDCCVACASAPRDRRWLKSSACPCWIAMAREGAKPVLDGSFWLGMIGPSGNNPHRHHAIAHLHRCLAFWAESEPRTPRQCIFRTSISVQDLQWLMG